MIRKVFVAILAKDKDGRLLLCGHETKLVSGSSESACEAAAGRQVVTENAHKHFRITGSVPLMVPKPVYSVCGCCVEAPCPVHGSGYDGIE